MTAASRDWQTNPHFALAREVVTRLRSSGHQAYFAGGCVRDWLMGMTPKDFDVATSAPPDEVRRIFGKRRTLAVGAAFGVIVVRQPGSPFQIEVATFRRDLGYTDGRHPDGVVFSTPQEDAKRRDFTINGLFFDPIEESVVDYVGGRDDIQRRILRAIGNPRERFEEDRLRMLRAIRFACTLDFQLDVDTLVAIRDLAPEIHAVSAERIGVEMRKILSGPWRARGLRLLHESSLLPEVFPEAMAWDWASRDVPAPLVALPAVDFPASLALFVLILARGEDLRVARPSPDADPESRAIRRLTAELQTRWRLSSEERDAAVWLAIHLDDVRTASADVWPRIQRILISPLAPRLLDMAEATPSDHAGQQDALDYCRRQLALPAEVLNPPPLLSGNDLIRLGVPKGPIYAELLTHLRDAQLSGRLTSREQAMTEVESLRDRWAGRRP